MRATRTNVNCAGCGRSGRGEKRPHTSASASPRLIAFELPDNAPRTLPYALPLESKFGLGEAALTYRLVAVLYYCHNYHFVSDVLDPRDRAWLRFDGMHARGLGQPVASPRGRVEHRGRRYYPVAAVYISGGRAAGSSAAGSSASPATSLDAVRRQGNVWVDNSCYVDASLVVWEFIQRWLQVGE